MKKRLILIITIAVAVLSVIFAIINPLGDILPSDSDFAIHFIDVGQADAALVICDGKTMLIDGGNVADSGLIYTYLKDRDIKHLDYVVATHAHEDHIGGLAGALNYATVGTVYCPVTSYDSNAFEDFVKYVDRRNAEITVPSVGDVFDLGNAKVTIIGCNASDDTNDTSIILRITYGNTSFLFTGDAERAAETAVIESGYSLESTVLKVGHHGSDTSTSYRFLLEIMPKYAVISVGENNEYGHPTDEVLSRLRDADVTVYRTDIQGTIICTSDGDEVKFEVFKNSAANTLGNVAKPADGTENVAVDTDAPVTELPETNAPETEIIETKAPETEPVETDLPETEPVETDLPETESIETEASETDGLETEASESVPVETDAQETKPIETAAPETESVETDTPASNPTYILNINPSSLRFHYPSCKSVDKMKEENKKLFYGTREEAISMGYIPCGNCNP